MDMNNAFDEILKIQNKLDKNNTVNPKITVAGKECTLYHTGNKPSASDIGANSGLFSGSIPSMTDGWINGVDTVILNYNNCFHAQAMSYFQAPVDGFYRISGQVSVSGESALYYYKNSSSSPTGTVFHTSSDDKNRYEHFISPVIPLSQGDTLRFYANTSSAFRIKSLTIEKINGGI